MDSETRQAIDSINRDIRAIEGKLHCPMDGCRFQEWRGGKVTGVANWVSTITLVAFIIFEVWGRLT